MADTFLLLQILIIAIDIDNFAKSVLKLFLLVIGPVLLGTLTGVFEYVQTRDVVFVWLIFVLVKQI